MKMYRDEETGIQLPVSQLRPGMWLNMPAEDEDDGSMYGYEYQVVYEVIEETGATVVHFLNDNVHAFPKDATVNLYAWPPEKEIE